MKPKAQEKKKKSNKKTFLLIVFAVILLGIIGWLGYAVLKPAPTYPLSNQLEYLGEDKVGCYGFCDSLPITTYYYGTDMSADEVGQHFKATSYEIDEMSDLATIKLSTGSVEKSIYLYYYEHKESSPPNLKHTTKKHLVTISAKDYQAAKDSL